jgi:hypothetical protein
LTVGTGLRLSGWVSTPQWMEIGELAARGARQNGHVFSILRSGKCLDSTHEIMTIIEQSHKGRTDGRKRVQYSTVQYNTNQHEREGNSGSKELIMTNPSGHPVLWLDRASLSCARPRLQHQSARRKSARIGLAVVYIVSKIAVQFRKEIQTYGWRNAIGRSEGIY